MPPPVCVRSIGPNPRKRNPHGLGITHSLPGKRIGDVGVRQRVAMAGGRLVVDGDARQLCLRVGEGMHHVAERQQRPARAGRRHLRLESVALGLRRDRIGGAVHRQHRRLDVARLGGLRRRQCPMHGHDRLHVGAGAREIEHVEAAEAEADRGAPGDVADRAPVGLPRQGVERGRDAPAHAGDVGHERLAGTPSGSSVPTGPLPSPNMSATNTT